MMPPTMASFIITQKPSVGSVTWNLTFAAIVAPYFSISAALIPAHIGLTSTWKNWLQK